LAAADQIVIPTAWNAAGPFPLVRFKHRVACFHQRRSRTVPVLIWYGGKI